MVLRRRRRLSARLGGQTDLLYQEHSFSICINMTLFLLDASTYVDATWGYGTLPIVTYLLDVSHAVSVSTLSLGRVRRTNALFPRNL